MIKFLKLLHAYQNFVNLVIVIILLLLVSSSSTVQDFCVPHSVIVIHMDNMLANGHIQNGFEMPVPLEYFQQFKPICTRQPLNPANMGEKTSFSCVKYAFFGFNVFVWLMGCGVLSLGVWLQVNRSPHMAILPSHSFFSASVLCITVGAIILLVGFLGCCGAFYENQCMLIGYFIMVLLIFTLEITAGTLGFLHKDEMRSMIQKDLLLSIQQDYRASGSESHHSGSQSQDHEEWWLVMDSLQAELQCCGVNNHTDWYRIKAWPTEYRVPDSCCKEPRKSCGQLDPRFWFERGCLAETDYWFVRNMYILGVVGITVAVVQILGMVAAVVLFCYIRNNKFFL